MYPLSQVFIGTGVECVLAAIVRVVVFGTYHVLLHSRDFFKPRLPPRTAKPYLSLSNIDIGDHVTSVVISNRNKCNHSLRSPYNVRRTYDVQRIQRFYFVITYVRHSIVRHSYLRCKMYYVRHTSYDVHRNLCRLVCDNRDNIPYYSSRYRECIM